jgi:mxaK protein
MVAADRLKRWLWPGAAVLALACASGGARIGQVLRFDADLRAGRLDDAGRAGGERGAFAAALAMQRDGRFEEALRAYGAIDTDDDDLRTALRYNLANLYLRRALELGDSAGGDVVGPLIELAKQEYRDVLREDDDAWDARYNLELALSVQPDVDEVDAAAEAMPEHSRRAIATQRKLERLP